MRKFIQNKLKDQKGLTLIELLAVIVILAIIAAIAIPAIGNIIENSRVGAIKSDATNIMAAADIFYSDGNSGADATKVTVAELKSEGYLDNAGSFEADSAGTFVTKVVKADAAASPAIVGAPAKITGDAVVGKVELTFTGATRDNVNKLKNNLSNVGASGAAIAKTASGS